MAGKVRILKEKLFKFNEEDTKLSYVEGACDDDATPPQGNFVTGSAFENVTSGNKYKYSETSGDWVLQPSEGGGTGGGGDVMVVTLTYDEDADDDTYTSSATATEIATANSEGKVVIGKTGVTSFFVSVVDIMGMISIDGIQLSKSGETVIYHLFSMDTTTNKWTDTPL